MPRFLTVARLSRWPSACARAAKDRTPPAVGAERAAPAPPLAAPSTRVQAPVQIEMKNVRLHVDDGIVLDVASPARRDGQQERPDSRRCSTISGRMCCASSGRRRDGHGEPDEPDERHVFAYEDAPLSDITVEIDEGRLKLKAKLHKGVPVPISMKADVVATPDGRMRLKTEKVSALSVPAKKLMDLFGLELDDVVSLKSAAASRSRTTTSSSRRARCCRRRRCRAGCRASQIVNGRLHQTFGSPSAPAPAER